MDVTIHAALAAGSFAATRRTGPPNRGDEIQCTFHQGNGSHIFMNSVDDDTIMITVFGPRTTVGVSVEFSPPRPLSQSELLKSLDKSGGHGFTFEAGDVTATPIFVDHPVILVCSAEKWAPPLAAKESSAGLCSTAHKFPAPQASPIRRGCAIGVMREIHPHGLWRFNSGITTRRSVSRRRQVPMKSKALFVSSRANTIPTWPSPKKKLRLRRNSNNERGLRSPE